MNDANIYMPYASKAALVIYCLAAQWLSSAREIMFWNHDRARMCNCLKNIDKTDLLKTTTVGQQVTRTSDVDGERHASFLAWFGVPLTPAEDRWLAFLKKKITSEMEDDLLQISRSSLGLRTGLLGWPQLTVSFHPAPGTPRRDSAVSIG